MLPWMNDFTVAKYRELLSEILRSGYNVYGVAEWLKSNPSKGVLIRHDIDRTPGNALLTARAESDLGIRSTYYCRILPHCFKPHILHEIASMGHEIGYHYEDLALARGDFKEALRLFRIHLTQVRELYPVTTVAMHGSPLAPYDNRLIWKHAKLTDFDLIGEAFQTVDYSNMYYCTDTGRTWGETKANLRDRPAKFLTADVDTTNDLIKFVGSTPNLQLALVTHPERWSDSAFHWHFQKLRDTTFNVAKLLLRSLRAKGALKTQEV